MNSVSILRHFLQMISDMRKSWFFNFICMTKQYDTREDWCYIKRLKDFFCITNLHRKVHKNLHGKVNKINKKGYIMIWHSAQLALLQSNVNLSNRCFFNCLQNCWREKIFAKKYNWLLLENTGLTVGGAVLIRLPHWHALLPSLAIVGG